MNTKATMLTFKTILMQATELYPGVNIVGGSVKQDFMLQERLDYKVRDFSKGTASHKSCGLHT